MPEPKLTDRHKQTLAVGDIIRIVQLSDEFVESFPADERILISSMVGKLFKIIAQDELGQACVMREWHDERGQPQSHVIALDPEEMEKV